jgi:hypothetical protein
LGSSTTKRVLGSSTSRRTLEEPFCLELRDDVLDVDDLEPERGRDFLSGSYGMLGEVRKEESVISVIAPTPPTASVAVAGA